MFSYIFTYRQIAPDRYQNLLTTLDWLNTVPGDFELVVVEQDDAPKLKLPSKYKFPIVHEYVYNADLFNRSWGFNIATEIAKYDIVMFADSDMIVPQNSIVESVNLMQSSAYNSVKPFNKIIDLSAAQIKTLNATQDIGKLQLPKGEHNPTRGGWCYCSGIVGYTKDVLVKMHGWDERFEGWGGEDNIQFLKTKFYAKHLMLKNNCYHLYHSRGKFNGTNKHPKYKKNLDLYFKYMRSPHSIKIDMIGKNSANRNLYSSK
jgi:hypothetical protein